jgi:phosphoenolpyruvate-protein phosphotransferase
MRSTQRERAGRRTSRTLTGEGISPGLAVGKAWIYEDVTDRKSRRSGIDRSEVVRQHGRMDRAIEQVLYDLERSADHVEHELNGELARVFRAHQALLTSPALVDELRSELEHELVDAEETVRRVFWRWEGRFASNRGGESARYADDVADLSRRLIHALSGYLAHPLARIPQGSIVVASRLLPSDTVHLSRRSAVAVLAVQASIGSHAALIASERGIPAVAQLPSLLREVTAGDTVLVDGLAGTVVLRPDEETEEQFRRRMARQRRSDSAVRKRAHEVATTRDGTRIKVAANVGSREDVLLAAENGADAIGLFRLESLLMTSASLPSEAQLLVQLRSALEAFRGKMVTIRLLDAGGDKPVPWLDLPDEAIPVLGRRGLRLLLHHPELLESQLRTFLRLSREHELRILVPMVTLAEEMQHVRELAGRVAQSMGVSDLPPLGAMIETPAAALCSAEIATHADFLSIGTNDLTQYTMAADRENPTACHYFQEDHPAVLKLIETVCEQAGKLPVSLCGELAGRPAAVPQLVKLGVRTLSVAPPLVPNIKEVVRSLSI